MRLLGLVMVLVVAVRVRVPVVPGLLHMPLIVLIMASEAAAVAGLAFLTLRELRPAPRPYPSWRQA